MILLALSLSVCTLSPEFDARARVSLNSGETRTVSIPVTARELAVYREDGTPFVPAGRHTAFIGGGHPDFAETREASFEVDGKGEVP